MADHPFYTYLRERLRKRKLSEKELCHRVGVNLTYFAYRRRRGLAPAIEVLKGVAFELKRPYIEVLLEAGEARSADLFAFSASRRKA